MHPKALTSRILHRIRAEKPHFARLALFAGLFAFIITRASAQPTTNVVQHAYLALKGIKQLHHERSDWRPHNE